MSNEPEPWLHHEVTVRSVKFHYVEAGVGEGRPLVLLLHGFPEFWYSWRHQIPVLADAGFAVIALDMRGYNLSGKSHGVDHYQIEHLTDDVEALIKVWGYESAILVGHDWGGIVAWHTAMRHPQIVRQLVILNAPHTGAYLRELWHVKQLFRSWYIGLFQIPFISEALLRMGRYAALRRLIKPICSNDVEMEKYIQAWQQPGALTGMLCYYRAAFRRVIKGSLKRTLQPVQAPTLLIWGEKDPALGIALTQSLNQWVPNLRLERLPAVGHFVQNQEPRRVNELLLNFLKEDASC